MKKICYLMGLLLALVVSGIAFTSCSDDDPVKNEQKGEQPTEDPEKNTTDVAVTGPVLDYGALYADIKGVVNLNAITASYSKVGFGICISETPNMDDGDDIWVDNLIGRTIKAHFLLEPSTKYYYATFVNVPTLSYVYWGKTYSFTTKPISKDAAVTGSVSDIGEFSAKFSGTTNPKEVYAAGAKATAGIEIAEDAEFASSYHQIKVNDDIEKFNVEATSLAPNKKYYYRTYLLATYYYDDDDPWEDEIYIYGDTQSFTTKPINEDAVVTGDATNIGMSKARISGNTNLKQFEEAGIKTSVGIELSKKEDFSNARNVSVTGNVENFNMEVISLSSKTKYYYRSYLKFSLDSQENYYYGEIKSFTTKESDTPSDYVDLGLPSGTLWATYNIGSTCPEDYGDYFAWGETKGYYSGKTTFEWGTYKWCEGSERKITKYCNNSRFGYNGFVDGRTELALVDDAAYANWGSGWRMPTETQCRELINDRYTTTEWTTQNGVNGMKVTSKTNGNFIFLPAAGYRDDKIIFTGSYGYYWSCSLLADYPYARALNFFVSYWVDLGNPTRCYGRSVRPVRASE